MGFIKSIGLYKQYDDVDPGKNTSRVIQDNMGTMSRGTRDAGRAMALVAFTIEVSEEITIVTKLGRTVKYCKIWSLIHV